MPQRALHILLAFAIATLPILLVLNAPDHPADAVNVQSLVFVRVCGNGIVDFGEVCDQGVGNNNGAYGSTTAERHCLSDCSGYGPYCGDGVLQARFSEACDDGNTSNTDLCSNTCQILPAVPTSPQGAPTVGATPQIPGAVPGAIPAEIPTKVVLRGKAYPNADVRVLLDGKVLGTTRADVNADFLFTTTDVTPGTATFGFTAEDQNGVTSITTNIVFDVIQSAITTVANIFFPPTIVASATNVTPGTPITLSGQTVPNASVFTQINGASRSTLNSTADESGVWALQLDTSSLSPGTNNAKAYFMFDTTTRSGFGRTVNFDVGAGTVAQTGNCDLNNDSRCNLIDFSIFLTMWGSSDPRGDFNHDGQVNLADFSIMLFNWTG